MIIKSEQPRVLTTCNWRRWRAILLIPIMKAPTLICTIFLLCCSPNSDLPKDNNNTSLNSEPNEEPMKPQTQVLETFENKSTDINDEILISEILKYHSYDSIFQLVKKMDIGHLFTTDSYSMDGSIGDDSKRLRIHIATAIKSPEDSILYKIIGKTKVNSNICDFTGNIRVTSFNKYRDELDDEGEPPYEVLGSVSGDFEFYEVKSQKGSGVFRGTFSINWNIYQSKLTIGSAWYTYNESMVNFSGTWTSYETGNKKVVCWGDKPSCLPSDFNCSDGPDLIPCDEYAKNGWETLRDVFDSNEEKRKASEKIESEHWWK